MKKYLKTMEEIAKALQDEKVVYINNDDNQFKLINGVVFGFNGKITINPSIPFEPNHTYTYDIEPLKIEVGKFYRTRNGSKAFVYSQINFDCSYPFYVVVVGKLDTYNVNAEGKQDDEEQLPLDLVAPWEE